MIALKEVKRLVLQVFKRKPNITYFCMGMGTWSFNDKNGNHVDTYNEHFQMNGNHAYTYTSKAWAKNINDFFVDFDSTLKITGEYLVMRREDFLDKLK